MPSPLETEAAIVSLKKKLGSKVCILGHNHQRDDVVRHCHQVGDTLELIRQISRVEAPYIVFCGVSFMGETASLLARPDQKIFLPAGAGSSRMAGMPTAEAVENVFSELERRHLPALPLVYVNSTLALKAAAGRHGGALYTSSSLRQLLAWAFRRSPRVLCLPDRNLPRNTAREMGLTEADWHELQVDEKGLAPGVSQPLDRHLLIWPGYCRLHQAYTPAMINEHRYAHPGCRVIVHSEARVQVVDLADAAGSTSFLIRDADETAKAGKTKFLVIGTERNLVQRLHQRHMNKCTILPLLDDETQCDDTAVVRPEQLLEVLQGIVSGKARPVTLAEEDRKAAASCVTRMLSVCGA